MTCRERRDNDRARQAALYSFLLSRGDKYTSMEQATDSVSLYPAYFNGYYHNSSARRLLTRDIEEINGSEAYPKIIISTKHGIKLASENEFKRFLDAEFREIFRKLKRVSKIAKKGSADQQINLEGEIREAFLGEEHG